MPKAYVIGSGPNGFAAAITLAQAGVLTTLLEAKSTIGGGTRSAELTFPGFIHDLCSAVHPMALSSPFFKSLPLERYGLEWIFSPAPLAHPLSDGSAVLLESSIEKTCAQFPKDAARYRRLLEPLARRWQDLTPEILGPLHIPKHPFLLARFGVFALWPAALLARTLFTTREARALFAGVAAHSFLPLERPVSSAIGLVLTLAGHTVGWPIPKGGSQKIAQALAGYFESLGGRIITEHHVESVTELKEADLVICDVTPRQLLHLGKNRFPDAYLKKLEAYRYGPGAFKMDWALSGPIPWRAKECARAATVHVCGDLEDIAASERAPWEGKESERPFVLVAQPSLFDPSRAPTGKHTAWAYCHVPNGSPRDMSERIESQIEWAAPGFRRLILAKHIFTPQQLEEHNPNLVGGDINGGAQDFSQMFWRPTRRLYETPVKGIYIGSASTPPGGGVHGMCGFHAAKRALDDLGIKTARFQRRL